LYPAAECRANTLAVPERGMTKPLSKIVHHMHAKAIKRQRHIGATKMPKKDKLSKSDKKMLKKAGKKSLKKMQGKGQKVERSNVSLI
jgi:hypothetical protein